MKKALSKFVLSLITSMACAIATTATASPVCALLSRDEAAKALGHPVADVTVLGGSICKWVSADVIGKSMGLVMVSVYDFNAADWLARGKGSRKLNSIGDEAYIKSDNEIPSLPLWSANAKVGKKMIDVSINQQAVPEETAVNLLKTAVGRLK